MGKYGKGMRREGEGLEGEGKVGMILVANLVVGRNMQTLKSIVRVIVVNRQGLMT